MENRSSFLANTILGEEIRLNRPEPIISDINVIPFKRRMDNQIAINALIDGYHVLVVDFYSTGLSVLNSLKQYVFSQHSNKSFQGHRNFRSLFRELSHRLLFLVSNNNLTVRKAPDIGWLKTLYPDLNEFLLPFPQVQGLNSSWQWYQKGISVPVLNRKIHPFFGTYFPTRFEHLKLFDSWLKKYDGEKKSAIDIGIGSGVLTFQMLKNGFEKVYGTDSNPNAIVGLYEDINRNELNSKIELFHGDLFANCNIKTEIIVFNPPWIPASYSTEGLDNAIYYDQNLFPRFFSEAYKHLKDNGIIVLLFSNLAQITKVSDSHPIETELFEHERFQKEFFIQKKVEPASKNTRRKINQADTEMVELWVLKLKQKLLY